MQKLHPRAFWLFFLSRSVGLLLVLSFLFLPMLLTTLGAIRMTERQTSRYERETGASEDLFEDEDSVSSVILRPFLYAHVGFALFILFALGVNFVWARMFYNLYRFELSPKGLKIEKGVIWKRYVTIPYDRIQNVDILRGVFDRLLTLSDLQVQTAGMSGMAMSEGRIPGLDPTHAEKLRDELVGKIGKNQGL